MGKTVFLFPGQGSQEVGMGYDLFREDEHFVSLVDTASKHVGEDLKKICLKGPEKMLARAVFVQPLLVAVSLGYLRHVHQKDIPGDYVLGHSLGEITALAASGVIDETTAIAIAAKRGQLMEEAAAMCDGAMMAVLSIDAQTIQTIIHTLGFQETIVIANFNAPDQTVVSGCRKALNDLSVEVFKAGGSCKKLAVAGPWHSPYLKSACEQFKNWAQALKFMPPKIPLILNGTGQSQDDPLKIKELVSASLVNPVYFDKCMLFCKSQNVDTFLEIGPGRVLSGLVRANGYGEATRTFKCNNLRGVAVASSELLSQSN